MFELIILGTIAFAVVGLYFVAEWAAGLFVDQDLDDRETTSEEEEDL